MLMPNDELKQATAEFLLKNGSPNQTNHQLLSKSTPPTADTPGRHLMSNKLIDTSTITDSAVVYDDPKNDAPVANKRRRFASFIDAVLLIILVLLVFKSGLFSYVRDLVNAD